MNTSLTFSDSLIGSLCREIDYIRQRYKILSSYLITSKDEILRKSLSKEIHQLKIRRIELMKISKNFKEEVNSSISNLLLYELCRRPLWN